MAVEYRIRLNDRHRGYLLVSCNYGHPLRCINTRDGSFAGSRNEADLSHNKVHCRDCEAEGRILEGRCA